MPPRPDPVDVANLQKRFTGLDDKLEYIPGHTIGAKYDVYKAASRAAGTAIGTYRTTASGLKATKPYRPGDRPVGPSVERKKFYRDGHQVLDPLAGAASSAQGFHADRRDSFNTTYEPVLTAKGHYQGHVKQAQEARDSQTNFNNYQQTHQKWS